MSISKQKNNGQNFQHTQQNAQTKEEDALYANAEDNNMEEENNEDEDQSEELE